MALSTPQREICDSEARFRVAVTGRRFGKTHVAMREISKFARYPNKQVWYVAPSYRMAKGIVWDQLKERLRQLRWVESTNESELTLRLVNGSKICLKGADNPDSLRGVGLDFLVLDEFQDMSPTTWEVLRPTLSDKRGHALLTGTPRGVGSWSHEMYTMAKSTQDWASFTYTTLEGGQVPEEEIEQAMRDMDSRTFEQEYLASFTTYRGVVYYNFSREDTIKDLNAIQTDRLHCGIDFNVSPMSVCISVIKNDIIYIVDEIVIEGSNTDEIIEELRTRYPKSDITMYPDPACRQRRSSAGGRTDLSILQNAGLKVKVRSSHTPIRDRVNAVNTKLKNATGLRTMYIDPKCKQTIKSLEKMVYKPGTSVVEKADGLDHMADAVGYLIDYLYPVHTNIDPQPPQRWAFTGNTQARSWT